MGWLAESIEQNEENGSKQLAEFLIGYENLSNYQRNESDNEKRDERIKRLIMIRDKAELYKISMSAEGLSVLLRHGL